MVWFQKRGICILKELNKALLFAPPSDTHINVPNDFVSYFLSPFKTPNFTIKQIENKKNVSDVGKECKEGNGIFNLIL